MEFTTAIGTFLRQHFNITADIEALPGYQDRNFLIAASSGERYILKLTEGVEEYGFLLSQSRIQKELAGKPYGKVIPCPIENIEGQLITGLSIQGCDHYARLYPYIPGKFLAEANPRLPFYRRLGMRFAELDRDLAGREDAILKSRSHEWDLARVDELTGDADLVGDPADRRLVRYFLMKHREEVLPAHHRFPRGLIHGDGNDYNLLLSEDETGLTGILDFGDMVYGARVNELAILLAYTLMGREDFEEVFREVVAGYQEIIRLTDEESRLLYFLVAARWCQTMIMAARKERDSPDSAYHQVSVAGARAMLHRWIRTNPVGLASDRKEAQQEADELKDLQERRYRYFSKALSLSYPEPIHMAGAAMQYMYGADGRTYLDCVNNIPHVGHCHPRVVEAGQRQMARLNTNTRYLYRSLDQYAEKLLTKFPPSLNRVFFVNSGSAATDLAVRLIKAHTGQSDFLVLNHAYHGNTLSAIDLSPYKFNRKGGRGKPGHVHILGLPGESSGGQQSDLQDLRDLEGRTVADIAPAGFFAEPIPGCAGQVMLNADFLQAIYRDVRRAGGLCVSDEVQTGFGRVGEAFWGYELYGVVPDIVLLGKPMANGHPMGALVCTEEVARSFETGMEFFSSFGGNPVSCEIARAVLEVIEEEKLQENAKEVGEKLMNDLRFTIYNLPFGHRSPVTGHVSDIRGSGLFLGIEFIKDPATFEPDGETARAVVNRMKERGFLLSTDGPHNNVIKFKPPMCFSRENADDLIYHLQLTIYDLG
ncbi:MAG: aminotransferase class III-fold pyridoxal phosphate-dependent enzyme [Bacteroidales bacterium]